ncbi:epoxide hydrolase family protein [Catenuloplanes atrovinosus]|uniref:Microsomal epoxide hydrolase n=1 Tax=Catenuloplanes atrovinosus TaxID=137266 RepID=A0AAE3YM04_9ACTN|nr:epoxide hydrolase [Catenuloplanes atrovinosus]MDR7274786.1 microsomal epoxide hydrolase [Catenuloplanes atrovinosus]
MGEAIRPYRIDVPQVKLDDLRERLARTRWPDEPDGAGWDYGVPVEQLRDLAGTWARAFDWRAHEARLNALPQYTTVIDGTTVHFVHIARGRPPLLLTHGWPSSVLELTPLADRLDHDLVIPSIPGFGFSGPPRDRGWDPPRIAHAFATLMERLGYQRYAAHGGDWGAIITRALAVRVPDRLTGIHLTMLPHAVARPGMPLPDDLTPDERRTAEASRARHAHMMRHEAGYGMQQTTRPQTLAYALTDSPAGQLAWIAEKFRAWSDPATPISADDLLATVSVYWFTRTAGSSARLYFEHARTASPDVPRNTVPTAVAVFPHDTSIPVRRLAESTDLVTRWTLMPHGGHFPGLEVPHLLAADLTETFAGGSARRG